MKRFVAAALLFFASSAVAMAGTTGVLTGTVVDHKGAPVVGAEVRIVAPGYTCHDVTDAKGNFTFLQVPPDYYTVTIEHLGYNPVAYAGVPVRADQPLHLAFRMEPALKVVTHDFIQPGFPHYLGAGLRIGSDVYFIDGSNPFFRSSIRIGELLKDAPGIVVGP